jgi:peptidyl-prolyl cis-trans isomerase D
VEAAVKLDKAGKLAESAAADFAVTLFEQKITPATLDPLLATSHLTRQPLAAFSREDRPAELGIDPENIAKAFQLHDTHPFSEELKTQHGYAILVWRETIPARQPPYAEVREKVVAQWKAAEKKRLFTELGQTLHTRLEASLKAGTTFDQAVADAAAAASSAKLTVVNQTGFTLAQKREAVSSDPVYYVQGALGGLQKGQLSDMIPAPDADTPNLGQLVYVVDKKVPDLSPTGLPFAAAKQQMAAELAAYGENSVMSDLVQRELAKSAPAQP